MSHFLERLTYLARRRESFAGGHGELRDEDRLWEEGYRQRWQHDKIVRSTHGVNCTGSCSWKIYVKSGVVTWETQQTDYPRTRAGMPNHEPRGCSRGASYSWYLYSASRIKYPMVRGRLVKAWREARKTLAPVEAWASITGNTEVATSYKAMRGRGGFVRSTWDEVSEIIAAANVHTVKTWGPDRVIGFSPIPAMSMVSYASGARYLSLIGGTLMSFYDWYCDLPPSSPQTWGEQTDVPESADWYNSGYIIAWGSNVPQTRTPDAHFFVESRYNGTKVVAITPDYSEVAKLSDLWLHPKQGTDAAFAMAMGHVVLREFFLDRQVPYFQDYCRRYTDMPMLVRLRQDGDRWVPDRNLRQSDLPGAPEGGRADWKTVATTEPGGDLVVPRGSIGYRWPAEGEAKGRWNLEAKDGETDRDVTLALSVLDRRDDVVPVAFPYFGGRPHERFPENDQGGDVLLRNVPVRRVMLADGEALVATVFDLLCASYGLDRGLGGACARSYEDDVPYTPAWQEPITGVRAEQAIAVARGFADNAEKTNGRSMVILGAGMNHWYHQDMNYRSIINFLMMCGTVGVSGGGWAHYVGQEKLRPQTGWTMLDLRARLGEAAAPDEQHVLLLCPQRPVALREARRVRAAVAAGRQGRVSGQPHRPQRPGRAHGLAAVGAAARGQPADARGRGRGGRRSGEGPCRPGAREGPPDHGLRGSGQSGELPPQPLHLALESVRLVGQGPRILSCAISSAPGTGLQGKDLGEMGGQKPVDVAWRDPVPEGKLDLVVTLDFRMSTSCLYSDIVLPTASWYEKHDLNTSDMHPFIHPFTAAVDPVWESRSDWEIYKTIAKRFSELQRRPSRPSSGTWC